MKLLYDYDIFHRQNYGGISKYHAELLAGLKKNNDVKIHFPLLYNENRHLNLNRKSRIEKINKLSGKRITKTIARINQFLLNRELIKDDFDIYIPTYYNTEFLKLIHGKPFVLTVLDMIHELYPAYFTRDKTTVKNKYTLMVAATRIVTISHNTKNDIIKLYPDIDPEKIDVVHLGYSKESTIPKQVKVPDNYILFVGQRSDYKNFAFFFESAKEVLLKFQELFLVCTGPPFSSDEKRVFISCGLEKRVVHITPDDMELAYLYQEARCFIFPSLYEGFGIPLIEAMANGCPIITSKSGSLPEVAGDAAIYFETGIQHSLTTALYNVLNDNNLREDLILKGGERSKLFTWKNTVSAFYNTLKKINL